MAREPFVRQSEIVGAGDVPAAVRAAAEEDERAQVAAAVGRDDPETVRAFSYTFLACLVHDVNLVHGALDTLGIGNAEAVASTAWADGDAAEATVELPGGAIWRSAWLLLRGLATFQERARLYFVDGIHELEFGVPYHRDASAHHRVTTGQSTAGDTQTRSFVDDPYMAELVHFHDCVTTGLPCMTPPEQGMADIALLRDLFLRRRSLDVHVPLDNAEI
jgi:predicted dehydrogenase